MKLGFVDHNVPEPDIKHENMLKSSASFLFFSNRNSYFTETDLLLSTVTSQDIYLCNAHTCQFL